MRREAWFRWGFVSKILLMTVVTVGVINSRARLRWLVLAIAGSFALWFSMRCRASSCREANFGYTGRTTP